MCGRACSELSKVHSKAECVRLSKANLEIQGPSSQDKWNKKKKKKAYEEKLEQSQEPGITFDYSVVNVLRALELKVSKPEVWNDIMQLMDHNDQRKQDDNSTWQLWLTEVVPKLEEHFPDTDIRDALRILGIGITNSANLNLRNGGRGTGLYPTFARINHRCICNTKSIKHSDQKLQVRASFPILAGEEITNQYVKPLNGTAIRKHILRSKWYFECECPRCADPTELGSYLSAFMCTKCKHGTVLSSAPLNPDAKWTCLDCSAEFSVEHLQTYLDTTIDEVSSSESQQNLIHHYEECLHKFSNILHPGHQIFTDINSQLAILYGGPTSGGLEKLSRPELDRKIQVCHQVLDTNGKVDPGYTVWRAKILVQLTQTKVHLATKDFKAGFINAEQLDNVLREEKFLRVYLAYYQSVFMGY